MRSLNWIVSTLRQAISATVEQNMRFDDVKMNQGILLARLNEKKESKHLKDHEFKIFSQWGEDGIIQRLISVLAIKNKTFIEFGVEDFFESNCRYLMMKDNWSGFVIDGSAHNIAKLKQSYFYWRYDLASLNAFITRENINDLLAKSGFGEDLGILSIDLDGNDYHILEAIGFFKPRILICEYNAIFGAERAITIPYNAGFVQSAAHYSTLYCGASLGALTRLAEKKGYSLVGTNTAGNNAFFVRNDLLNDQIEVLSVEEAFTPSKFRSSRDKEGDLSYISGDRRFELIKGLPVFNVEKNVIESL